MAKPNTTLPRLTEQDVQRFHSKVQKDEPDQCWSWTGKPDDDGYGLLKIRRVSENLCKMVKAHRIAYLLANSTDPGNLLVLHDCDNRLCCNPSHLSLGTPKKNITDAKSRGRMAFGERQGGAIFTEAQVLKIRSMYKKLSRKYKLRRRIARVFNCSESAVHKIAYGYTWAHLL